MSKYYARKVSSEEVHFYKEGDNSYISIDTENQWLTPFPLEPSNSDGIGEDFKEISEELYLQLVSKYNSVADHFEQIGFELMKVYELIKNL